MMTTSRVNDVPGLRDLGSTRSTFHVCHLLLKTESISFFIYVSEINISVENEINTTNNEITHQSNLF